MKLVHLADLHLGYRAYHRTDDRGINVREADVARAFRQALDRILEIGPEVVLVAGDVFHTVRPSNSAIADAFRQFARFTAELPEARVVVVAGNHDSPRAVETGSILRLFTEIPGIHVVHQEAKQLHFPELDLAVLCLPHNALASEPRPAIEPVPGVGHNLLLAHAEYETAHSRLILDFGAARLGREELVPEAWDYVALGNHHVRERLGPNMYYAGAIERTSLNIWAEADNAPELKRKFEDPWPDVEWGKGFVEYDLEERTARFHRLDGLRPVLDLRPINHQSGGSAEDVDLQIEDRLSDLDGGIEGKIVRLRVFDLPRPVYRDLDHRRIREFRTRALHFHLDVRPPRVVRRVGSAAPGRRLSLQEELQAFLEQRWETSLDEKGRDRLVELGLGYLQEVEEAEAVEGG